MTICFLALGSNLRSPERQLRQAIKAIKRLPKSHVLAIANFYKNPAVGRKAQPLFYNTVISIRSFLEPERLLQACQTVESQQGRIRRFKNGARTLDVDILLYGKRQVNLKNLTIPHPHMLSRDFVMVPLSELLAYTRITGVI